MFTFVPRLKHHHRKKTINHMEDVILCSQCIRSLRNIEKQEKEIVSNPWTFSMLVNYFFISLSCLCRIMYCKYILVIKVNILMYHFITRSQKEKVKAKSNDVLTLQKHKKFRQAMGLSGDEDASTD